MATNNSNNNQFTNNSDGFTLAGGTTQRSLEVTAGNVTLSSGGSNTYTFPAATDTLVGRASTDTLTNKTLSDSSNTLGASDVGYFTITGTGNYTASLAFKPAIILFDATLQQGYASGHQTSISTGYYRNADGSYECAWINNNGTSSGGGNTTSYGVYTVTGGSTVQASGTVTSISTSGFTLNIGTYGGVNTVVRWTAIR